MVSGVRGAWPVESLVFARWIALGDGDQLVCVGVVHVDRLFLVRVMVLSYVMGEHGVYFFLGELLSLGHLPIL